MGTVIVPVSLGRNTERAGDRLIESLLSFLLCAWYPLSHKNLFSIFMDNMSVFNLLEPVLLDVVS